MPANTDSPAKLNEKLQRLLNETVGAQNFELESKTTDTFRQLMSIEKYLPADETGLSSYYTLFNAWIRWLCEWDNYCLNLLHRRRLIGYLNRRLGVGKFDLEIYPYATRLYGIQQQQGIHRIQLHEGLDYMNEVECQKLAQLVAAKRWNDLRQLIRDYQRSTPQYMDLVTFFRDTKVRKAPENDTKGKYYDLESIFQTCNRRYFNGKMPRPRGLHWSARVNHSTMGSYNLKEDTLMINRGLDSGKVPEYVPDFVMYHELLHKLLGIDTTGSRNRAHTPEFRKLEQAHPDYLRAQDFIRKNAAKL